ncbi:MAG TPA: UdgX family uracil-DNA binding protein [Casimicrobiaceae bacterium]|nr:UdgX family uracil-DNA binding protein [Casimicrobiaceae bacterium]
MTAPSDPPVLPPTKANIDACRRCELWQEGTQGVPGAGSPRATVLLVGEQPGDEEDRQGLPFVGPAGLLLQRAMADAGLKPGETFLTNAVKHFHNEPRGKRRMHKTPAQRHIEACRGWLEQEIARVGPRVIVALGATALNSVMGAKLKVGEARERTLRHASGTPVIASYHPSAALRAPEKDARDALYATIVGDLRKASRLAARDKG